MRQQTLKTELKLKADEAALTIVMPVPANPTDQSYERIHRDIGRIQWLSKGNGGVLREGLMTLSFELEEFRCALKYLTRFEWVLTEICPRCACEAPITQLVE